MMWTGIGKKVEEARTQEVQNEVEDMMGGGHNLWVLVGQFLKLGSIRNAMEHFK